MQDSTYDDRLIEAFVNKDEKTSWYQNAFAKLELLGDNSPQWFWSWWGFFFGFGFLLYRKAYLPSAVVFLAGTLSSVFAPALSLPITLIIMVATGGFSTFYIYADFKKKSRYLESTISNEQERIEAMRAVGGVHQWLIYLYGVIVTLIFLSTVVGLLGLAQI